MKFNWMKNFVVGSSGIFFAGLIYAGEAAIKITPSYTASIQLPPGRSTTIEYIIKNKMNSSTTLTFKNIPGVNQIIESGYCDTTFTLLPNNSCTIKLQINGDSIPDSGINTKIQFCDTANLCYQSSNPLIAFKDKGLAGGATTGKILIFSDIHYNSLSKTDPGHYQNSTYPTGNETNPNNDPNQGMLDNFIAEATSIANQGGPPDFVLVNGDFIAHGLVPGLCNEDCVKGTIEYPLSKIWNSSNGVLNNIPIYPAIGNNDSYLGDYQISSVDGFYQDIGAIFAKYVLPENSSNFISDFNANYANYITDIPTTCVDNNCKKIMVLNTVPFSNKVDELQCNGTPDCSGFRYITQDFARKSTKPAIVSMHIAYTNQYGADTNTDNQLSDTSLFSKCSSSNPSCVSQVWAGHWHWFSPPPGVPTYPPNGQSINTILAPSVTPRKGAIPGFLIVSYNRASGNIISITSYTIPNYASALQGKPLSTPISFTANTYTLG